MEQAYHDIERAEATRLLVAGERETLGVEVGKMEEELALLQACM